ncbi:hypothetical protein JKY79_01720 [Candidatus Babeliales bacterium]|nr:hypothetical protein [Candidatus Babeliales bacterium]
MRLIEEHKYNDLEELVVTFEGNRCEHVLPIQVYNFICNSIVVMEEVDKYIYPNDILNIVREYYLTKHLHVNTEYDSSTLTPLIIACERGNDKVVHWLVNIYNCDIKSQTYNTPFVGLIKYNCFDTFLKIFNILTKNGNIIDIDYKIYRTVFIASLGRFKITKKLMKRGFDPSKYYNETYCDPHRDYTTTQYFTKRYDHYVTNHDEKIYEKSLKLLLKYDKKMLSDRTYAKGILGNCEEYSKSYQLVLKSIILNKIQTDTKIFKMIEIAFNNGLFEYVEQVIWEVIWPQNK